MTNSTTTPDQATPCYLGGDSFLNITTSTYTQIATGKTAFGGLTVNTAGTTSAAAFYDGISATVTVTIASPGVFTWTAHPFAAGDAVQFTTTGALPTGLVAGRTYYVSINGLTADEFEVADTQAHALAGTNTIDTSGTQSGVHTGWDVSTPIGTFNTAAQANLPIGVNGAYCSLGLLVITTDGGGAADITAFYHS